MMRILVKHAKHYRIRTFRTLSSWANQTLHHRLAEALDQKAQIIPVLQQWRQQGNQINPSHVRVIINKLRDSDQSLQALQVSEWMSKEKICSLTPEDFAARFCLIDNAVGLEEAETFFESIPNSARDESVYTSLLSSYTRSDKAVSKAEATFKKMSELGLLTTPSPYNAMISLYSALKNRDKVDELLLEMQGKVIAPDTVTVNHVLKLYAAVSDVTAMEKFLAEWNANFDNWSALEWLTTLDMAKAYLKDGSEQKAIHMLSLAEKLVEPESFKQAYELMNMYGEAGKIEEVLRIWNLYTSSTEQCDNKDYLKVIRLLLKLDDISGAEEIYKVWESLPLEFDISIPATLASGYRNRGIEDEADKLMNSRIIKCRRMNEPINPLLDQWGSRMRVSELKCLIRNLHDSNQFPKALQVSEWMDEKRASSLYPEDYAARLHMVDVVLGLEQAEKFFENIPTNMRDYTVYSTLLSSYAKSDKHLGEAKETFEKMRELGFLMKPSPFNSMLSFHSQENNMVEEILREMEENSVAPDSLMVNKVLRIYAAASNVQAMETLMKKWSGEEGIKLERETMAAVANTYAKAGSIGKAIEMYGVAGSKEEVYRLWDEYKKKEGLEDNWFCRACDENEKLGDDMYKTVIATLLKLDDVEGAEKAYRGWKPVGPNLDLSIPGLLISRFCAEGNKLKFGELINSIRGKRNGMHVRMVRDYIVRVVSYVAFGVFIFIVVVLGCFRRCPLIWFLIF